MPRSGAPLTRARIAAAGLSLVDRDGADAFTMRRLAEQLDVTPMALYNHVDDRQALLDDIAELVLAEVRIASSGAWREQLVRLATELRACYLRHPRAMPLVLSATRPSAALLAPMEACLAALDDAGFEPDEALELWATLVALVTGYSIYQLGGHLRGDGVGAIDADTLPRVARAAEAHLDWDLAFRRAVDQQLAAIEAPAPMAAPSRAVR